MSKVQLKLKKHTTPLTPDNIEEYSAGKLLDLHLASTSDQFVLAFEGSKVKAILISDLENLFKSNVGYPRSLQKLPDVKTTQATLPYGWVGLQRCRELTKQGRTVLVMYAPHIPFEWWDVTDVVSEFLGYVSIEEIFGQTR
jgi:hypothetical protein